MEWLPEGAGVWAGASWEEGPASVSRLHRVSPANVSWNSLEESVFGESRGGVLRRARRRWQALLEEFWVCAT